MSMPHVLWAVWVLVAAGIVAASLPLTGERRAQVSETEAAEISRRAGLPLPSMLRGPVVARLDDRGGTSLRWGLGGVALGLLAAIIAAQMLDTVAVVPTAVLTGGVVGLAAGMARAEHTAPPPLTPEAHVVDASGPQRVRGISTRSERMAFGLVPVAVLGAAVAGLAVWSRTPLAAGEGAGSTVITLVIAAVAAVAGWGAMVVVRSAVVARERRATNDLELAWDDTLRALAVRDVQDAGIGIGLLGIGAQLLPALYWLLDPAVRTADPSGAAWLGVAAAAACAVCALVLVVPWAIGRLRANPAAGLWAGRDFFPPEDDAAAGSD